MNDKRGHHKLRLSSRKHFKPKPKRRSNVPRETTSTPDDEDFYISLPLSVYTDASVKSVDALHNRIKSCAVIPSGWTDELKDSQLSIYQVKVYDHGAEDTFSIIIKKNFSWHLFRRQLVNPTCCSILRNTPSELDSVSKVKSLMEAISIGDICEDEVPLGFQISLPLSAYTDASVKSVDILHNRVKSCAVIPSGWNDELKDGKISIYQVKVLEHGAEVIFSLIIEKEFSWHLFFRKRLVSPACCSILRSTPSELDSVSKVKNLMETICVADICEGNPDERFLVLPNVHKGCMKDKPGTEIVAKVDSSMTGTSSIYHVNCEIIIKSTSLTKRCCNCKAHRQTLSAMVSRQQKIESSIASSCHSRSDPSSHTGYAYLRTPEKDERLRRLHKDKRKLSLRITCLEKKLSLATAQNGINLTEELHNDFKEIASDNIIQIQKSHPEDSLARLFWDQQVKASKFKKPTSMKWHPLFIKWCLYLRHLSGKSYELLRSSGCIKLPSQSTLRDYTHYIPSGIGFSAEVDKNLLDVAFLSNDLNKYVFLVMDEVHIKNDLVYDKHEGCLIGFVNLGEINNQLIEFERALAADQESSQPTLASSMIVLMVRGLFCRLNYPYAQFACSDVNGGLLFDPVWKAISRLEKLGFCVLGLTCDGASPNRRFWKLHSEKDDELTYKVPNPFANDGRHLYFISDPPHLLKTIRNSFCNSKRKLWCNGKEISWQHVVDFYYKDTAEGTGLRLVPKLKYEHINLTSFSKMRVDLAAQVMSESVACALEHTGGKEVEETVRFIRMVDKFFDCLNVTNLVNGKRKRKSFQSPYTSSNDFRIKWLADEFIPYLKEWEGSVEKRSGFSPQSKTMMVIAKETRNGINITVKSFLELIEYIFKIPGVKFFLSERMSQDPLENFFGCQRQRGRTSENPTVQEFCKNTQALRVINSVCGSISKGNCRGRKQLLDLEKENKPLAKRRRHREKKSKISTDHVDELAASMPTEPSSDEMSNVSSFTDEESNVTEKAALAVEKEALTRHQSHQNTPIKTNSVTMLPSNCDGLLTELSAEVTDRSLLTSPKAVMTLHQAKCHSWFSLNTSQEDMINEVLGPGASDEKIVNAYGITLQRRDFWTLNNCQWLNDQVINFYMNLIMERFSDVYTYSTFFYPKLRRDGYKAVCRWNKGVSIFTKRLLMLPVYLEEGAHWCLAAVNVAEKTITYFDSLKNDNSACLQVLRQYLTQESYAQGLEFHPEVWHSIHQKDIPVQTNSFDCGVFVCMYALHLAEDVPFEFTQDDMSDIRRLIAFQLLSTKLQLD